MVERTDNPSGAFLNVGRRMGWIDEAKWFLAGVVLTLGVFVGFFIVFALPLVLIGVTWAVVLSLQKRPGGWMLLTGVAATATVLYGADVLAAGGPCPYSNIVYSTGSGKAQCGPPETLKIFSAATGTFLASLFFSVTAHRRRIRKEH